MQLYVIHVVKVSQCFKANNALIAVRDTLEKSENDEFIASLNNVHQEIHP